MVPTRLRGFAFGVLICLGVACSNGPPVILETALVSDTNDEQGPYEVLSIIRDDGEVTGAWVFFSIDGRQNFEAVKMEPVTEDAYLGRIRGLPLGTRVDYYVLARDGDANVGTDPAPVPDQTHCFLVGVLPSNPAVLLVFPDRGPTTGGTGITIIGRDFRPGARVFVEGMPATGVAVIGATEITAITPPGSAGLADVTVENPSGFELGDAACARFGDTEPVRATLPDGFLYVLPPTPELVVPPSGPTAGGTTVTIRGEGFQEGALVTFDEEPALHCVVLSDTEIRCVTPPGDPGPADVEVVNPDGLRGTLPEGYLYVPPPEIFEVDPPRGPDTGGTEVTIRGQGFQEGAVVLFDDIVLEDIRFVDQGTLVGVTPPHFPGFVDVRVRNPDGQEGLLSQGFQYFGPPIVDRIVPPQGPTIGGQEVRIIGSSFVPGLTVTFDGLEAQVVSVTESEILVITPPHPEGPVVVQVTNPDGRSATGGYVYVPPPFVDSIMPRCGPATGGTTVTIAGRNFQQGATVFFGEFPAASVRVVSEAVIEATTAARTGPRAEVEVKVVNPDGGETPTPALFVFVPAPVVASVDPTTALLCGGETVTVRGSNFLPDATITVGGVACTNVEFVSDGELRCRSPLLEPGPQAIVVTNHECLDQPSMGTTQLRYERIRIEPQGGLIAGFTRVRLVHSRPLTRQVVGARFGGTEALEIGNDPGGVPTLQSPPNPQGPADVEVALEGCPPEATEQPFRYRVLVDETETRIPHPTCNSSVRTCQAADLRMADVNADGLLDFAQMNGGIDPSEVATNQLYVNRGDAPGFFEARNIPNGALGPRNTSRGSFADVDGDGDLDLLVAGSIGGHLYLNDGQGNFTESPFSGTLRNLGGSFDAQLADVNGDGLPDIIYLAIGNENPAQNGLDRLFLNQGGGRFVEVAGAFPTTLSVHDHKFAVADFNGDSFADIAIVVDSHFSPQPNHRLLLGDGTGRFRETPAPDLQAVFGDVFGIETGDYNGDGRPDLFLPVEGRASAGGACGFSISGVTNVLLLGGANGGLTDRSDLLPPLTDATIGSAQVDIDNDGDMDLISVNFGRPTRVLVNDGRAQFHDATAAWIDPPLCSLSATAGPIDQSGIPAIIVGGNYPTRLWIQR